MIASFGVTKAEVLALLAEALALHEGEDDPINDEKAFLRQVGVDPDEVPNGP